MSDNTSNLSFSGYAVSSDSDAAMQAIREAIGAASQPTIDSNAQALGQMASPIVSLTPQVSSQDIKKGPPVSSTKNRFSEAPWFTIMQNKQVTLIGAGGIGSWVAMCLARIGCKVIVYDHDLIEIHNLGGQMFSTSQVGLHKVTALKQTCQQFAGAGTAFVETTQSFGAGSSVSHIMIMAVDNMKTRKLAFEKWAKWSHMRPDGAVIFIDGRLLAEDYQVYAVTRGREDEYRETLFDDAEVPTEQCTLKSTTHCSLGIASDIVGVLTNFMANEATRNDKEIGIELRDVPFKIVKSIPNFMYDVTFVKDGSSNSTKEASKEEVPNKGSDKHITQPATVSPGSKPGEDSSKERANNSAVLQAHPAES